METAKCGEIARNVSIQQKSCEEDLAAAIPLVQQAEAALDVLNKKDFSELKALGKPPGGVDQVLEAVMWLQAGIEPSCEMDRKGRTKDGSAYKERPGQIFGWLKKLQITI